MSIFLIILLGIPVLSLVWLVWTWWKLRQIRAGGVWRIFVIAGISLALAGFAWIIAFRQGVAHAPVPAWLQAIVLIWGLICLPLLALPLMVGWTVTDLYRAVWKRLHKEPVPTKEVAAGEALTRRQWLGSAVLALPVLATFGGTAIGLPQTRHFRIRNLTVRLKDLPAALDGMRIAHLTDVHVGKFTRGEILTRIADAINDLQPDLTLVTGDLIDSSIEDLPEALDMITRIDPHAGLFMVEGNHDLFDGAEAFAAGVASRGVPLLRNRSATVELRGEKIELLGIRWSRDDRAMQHDVAALARARRSDAFPILLAHHPHAFDTAADHGIPLTLAGHTHGGQLMLTPEIGAGPMIFRYWSGLYQKNDCSLVVSNGAGNWFPLRTAAPAEIIHLTLRRA